MSPHLGKRKRRSAVAEQERLSASTNDAESDQEDLQDVFRRAFEAKFKPLPVAVKVLARLDEDEHIEDGEGQDESDWSGLSGDEQDIQIVEHNSRDRSNEQFSRQEMKAFMVHDSLCQRNEVQSTH